MCNTCCSADENRGAGATALPDPRLEVTTAVSQEPQGSSAADDQTPRGVSHHGLGREHHGIERRTDEATQDDAAERAGLLSPASTRQRPCPDSPGHDDGAGKEGCNEESEQQLPPHDREGNRARGCSPSSRTSGSEVCQKDTTRVQLHQLLPVMPSLGVLYAVCLCCDCYSLLFYSVMSPVLLF